MGDTHGPRRGAQKIKKKYERRNRSARRGRTQEADRKEATGRDRKESETQEPGGPNARNDRNQDLPESAPGLILKNGEHRARPSRVRNVCSTEITQEALLVVHARGRRTKFLLLLVAHAHPNRRDPPYGDAALPASPCAEAALGDSMHVDHREVRTGTCRQPTTGRQRQAPTGNDHQANTTGRPPRQAATGNLTTPQARTGRKGQARTGRGASPPGEARGAICYAHVTNGSLTEASSGAGASTQRTEHNPGVQHKADLYQKDRKTVTK